MSYAEAAASAINEDEKEVFEDKIKNGEAAAEAEIENAEATADDVYKRAKSAAEATAKDLKKELGELEEEGKSLYAKFVSCVLEKLKKLSESLSKYTACAQKTGGEVAQKTVVELQNPVVATQVVVGVTGAVAGYLAYLERGRIQTENKAVVFIHASVVTGLLLVDGFLFNKYYKQFRK